MHGYRFTAFAIFALLAHSARCQMKDTLVNAGGDRLHFHIVKGHGLPILFEAGGGDDATVWDSLLPPIARHTGATLITYDRAGFGRSQIDTTELDVGKHGIVHGIESLEGALSALGYAGTIMLVAHSYGGLYATLYANRHPTRVKAAVLVDASTACWFNDAFFRHFVVNAQEHNRAAYYQSANLAKTVAIVRSAPFPTTIPIIDLVSEHPPFSDTTEITRWKTCHRQFVAAAPKREGITAYGSGHYIFKDDPQLVIDAIVREYANADH